MENKELSNLLSKIGNQKDRLAFKSIFEYFAPRINAYLIKTGSNKDFAEDLTQEVMTVIWNKADLYNSMKSNVSTWIFTIARNKRIDSLRKKKDPKYNEIDLISSLYDQENEEKLSEDNNFFHKLSQKLNENDKILINMNFFEGKTHKIISETLEIPLGTVKSRIRKILSKLRENI
jgi:RNA polymerase sigma-70 factor (ECF subfamily)